MKIKNGYKLVFGVGINDADYSVQPRIGNQPKCPFYVKWHDMLKRCYYKKFQVSCPSYLGCSVVSEWLLFSNFKAWMENQNWEGNALDKDLLFPGNKIYGPDTCIFVSKKVNSFIVEKRINQGEFPVGASWHKASGKFVAQGTSLLSGKRESLGLFSTAEDAHKAWLAHKLEKAYILAAEQLDERVAKALIDRYENYSENPSID